MISTTDSPWAEAILVGLGANLPGPAGTPRQTLEAALAALEGEGISVRACSGFWASPAWPPSDQPPYLNAVARVETALGPEDLLQRLHAVEARFGRSRGERWAARPLDLDLLAHGRLQRAPAAAGAGDLALPHPRLAERAFVLLPLADVAPGWCHPLLGRSIAELIAALPLDHGTVRSVI